MKPHLKDFDNLIFLNNLINTPVSLSDSSGHTARKPASEPFGMSCVFEVCRSSFQFFQYLQTV